MTLIELRNKLKNIANRLDELEQEGDLGEYNDFQVIITDYKNGWRHIKDVQLNQTRVALQIAGELKPENKN